MMHNRVELCHIPFHKRVMNNICEQITTPKKGYHSPGATKGCSHYVDSILYDIGTTASGVNFYKNKHILIHKQDLKPFLRQLKGMQCYI